MTLHDLERTQRLQDLHRQAALERLARGSGLRHQLAAALHALARWLEPTPTPEGRRVHA